MPRDYATDYGTYLRTSTRSINRDIFLVILILADSCGDADKGVGCDRRDAVATAPSGLPQPEGEKRTYPRRSRKGAIVM
jgi:hypothetical protein